MGYRLAQTMTATCAQIHQRSTDHEINHDSRVRPRGLSALLAPLCHIQGASARLLRLAGDSVSRRTTDIIAQHESGLISLDEALTALQRAAKAARFARDYSDSLASYQRHDREAARAHYALHGLRGL